MSKLDIGGGQFLDELSQITLNSSFGTQLNTTIDHINKNFKKLISVPFLKGEHGENLEILEVALFENNEFSKLGRAIVEAIYGSVSGNDFDPSMDDPFGGTIVGINSSTNSYDKIDKSKNIKLKFYGYRDRNTNSEVFKVASQSLFIFIDSRINAIEDISTDQLTTFEDLSCALTVTGNIEVDINTGNKLYNGGSTSFNVLKHNIIPTLYYDESVKEWCWKINDAKTKISAQGLKGEDGKNATCVVCKGTLSSSDSYPYVVRIDSILTSAGFSPNEISNLSNGQLAIVWYEDPAYGEGNWNCSFGPVDYNSNTPKIYVGHHPNNAASHMNFDLLTAIGITRLRKEMNDIGNTENTPTGINSSDMSPRGLWVPNKFNHDPDGNPVHMIWSDNVTERNVVHFGVVDYGNTDGNVEINISHTNTPASIEEVFEMHYDKVRKDFIEAGRKFTLGPCSYTISSPMAPAVNKKSPRVTTATNSDIPTEINQYINVRSSDDPTATVSAFTSRGIILKKDPNETEKIYSIFIGNRMITMDSEISIGSSSMTITGTTKPSSLLSPLTNETSRQNFIDSEKVLINNENLFVTNGSLLVGTERAGMQSINAYVQHYGNSSIYNYDYFDVLNSSIPLISGVYTTDNNYWSLCRPRKIDFVPVAIGGYLTMYNSKTSNRTSVGISYNLIKTEPVMISKDENYKHTFLSGKMGWTGIIEQDGLSSLNGIQNITYLKAIKTYDFVPEEDNARYGVATSMSGLWTKIGNVVDVKGKIFFTGVKISYNETSKKASVDKSYQLTYGELYSFLHKNGDSIQFPLPIVIQEGNETYVSTGNLLEVPASTMLYSSISTGTPIDIHFGEQAIGRYPNKTGSSSLSPNNVLNGTATFEFYGTASILKKELSNIQISSDTPNFNRPFLTNIERSSIETLPNIFSCTAGLRLSSDKLGWKLASIPSDEVIDKMDSGLDFDLYNGRYGNTVGPVRFSFGNASDSGSYCCTHKYSIVRPFIKGITSANDKWTTDDPTNFDNRTDKLFAVTTISPYVVRCLTFQFSYLLDDDIDGSTPALNRSNQTRNWDTEKWNLLTDTSANNIDVSAGDIYDAAVKYSSSSDTWNTTETRTAVARQIDIDLTPVADKDIAASISEEVEDGESTER